MNKEQFLAFIVSGTYFYANGQAEISSADVLNMRKIALSQFASLGFSGDNPPPLNIFNEQMVAVVENYINAYTAPEKP